MGFLDNLFSGVQNVLGGAGNALQGAGKSIGGLMGNAGQGLMGMFGGGGQGGGGARQAYGNTVPMAQQFGGGALSHSPYQPGAGTFNPGGGAGRNTSSGVQQGGGANFMGNMFGGGAGGNIGAGAGIMGLGQLMGGHTKIPSFNTPQVQAFQQFNPQNFQTINPAMQKSIQDTLNIQNEQQTRNLRDVYKSARPGTDYTTDSAYQRDIANLQRNQGMTGADAMAQAQAQFNQQQLQANQQQQQQLGDLAQLSIGEIMAHTGMQAAEAQQLKNMFSGVGGMFINKGLWPNSNYGSMNGMDMFNGGNMR